MARTYYLNIGLLGLISLCYSPINRFKINNGKMALKSLQAAQFIGIFTVRIGIFTVKKRFDFIVASFYKMDVYLLSMPTLQIISIK